jgi:hypothetical protein
MDQLLLFCSRSFPRAALDSAGIIIAPDEIHIEKVHGFCLMWWVSVASSH